RNIPVDGLRSIQLRVKLPNGYRTVTLHGVMHAPRLAMNLISLSTLQKEGAEYSSTPFGLVVTLGNEVLMHGNLNEGLYRVDCMHVTTQAAHEASSGASLRVWHRWMGHLHLNAICELLRKNMV